MTCVKCGGATRVYDSRPETRLGVIYRRRECRRCRHRFKTAERVV